MALRISLIISAKSIEHVFHKTHNILNIICSTAFFHRILL